MEQPPNNIESSQENKKLIKEQIKRVSVFGPSSEQDQDTSEILKGLGTELSDLGLTIIMGGSKGALENVSSGAVENEGKVIVVGSTAGKEQGYVTKNTPGHLRGVYYEDGYSGKKIGLFERSGAYLILPGNSLGTYAELVDAIDKVANFDHYVDNAPMPIIFVGDYWKKHYDEVLEPMIRSKGYTEHIYFIKDETELEGILIKYAKIKQQYENKE